MHIESSRKKLELYLIRHGESEGNAGSILQGRAEFSLTKQGREQTRRLVEKLRARGVHPAAIYSSDQARALQTATILGEGLAVEGPVTLPDLREIDLGPVTGLTRADARSRFPDVMEQFARGVSLGEMLSGAETWAQAQRRGGRAFQTIRRRHPAGVVLVVSHGGLLVNMHKAILRIPSTQRFIIRIPNAAYSRFVFDEEYVWLAEMPCGHDGA
ncbi:MAG: histidine phosphatase family protein [Candidatus Wallbacteria bacterium]|nr:histidine phosphatase family protein [Candidatus Wallbacteria bacterium]